MRPERMNGNQPDWRIAVDEVVSTAGTIRLKVLAAVDGSPVGDLELWAADRGKGLELLRGLVTSLETKWGKIVIPRGITN